MFKEDRNSKELETGYNTGNKNETGISCNYSGMLNSPEILTGLSHEVRTYMNSIVAFSFLQSNDACDAKERQEYSNHILNSCDQLITLFDNFLDSALIEAETPDSVPSKRNINKYLQELSIELNSTLSKFSKDNVTLVLEEHPDSTEVFIEEEKINRVIKNLFHNALEHTLSGYIKIGYTKESGQLTFYVIDSGNAYNLNKALLSGKSMPDSYLTNNNTFTTIGLILAKKLIDNMGGELWIESNGINGTGIYFTIPEKNILTKESKDYKEIKSRIAI